MHEHLCKLAEGYVTALVTDGVLELFLQHHGKPSTGDLETDKVTAWDVAYDMYKEKLGLGYE